MKLSTGKIQDSAPRILYHVTPTKNVCKILSEGLKPQIGERSALLGETMPGVYFFAGLNEADDAGMNWLGDQFDDDESLSLLRVSLPNNHPLDSVAGWELVSRVVIAPAQIQIERMEF